MEPQTPYDTKQVLLTGYLYRGVFIYQESANRFVVFGEDGHYYAFENQCDVEAAINDLLDATIVLQSNLYLDA